MVTVRRPVRCTPLHVGSQARLASDDAALCSPFAIVFDFASAITLEMLLDVSSNRAKLLPSTACSNSEALKTTETLKTLRAGTIQARGASGPLPDPLTVAGP